jgi:hypothetical protein
MAVQMERRTKEITELSSVLWREREVMHLVLFKLTAERLVVSAAETRWLADANRELEGALEQLHNIEVLRAIESDALAEQLGLPSDATLSLLAQSVDEPWSVILAEHRDALLQLAGEIADAVDLNRRLLEAGGKSIRETLMSITSSAGTYDANGVADTARARLSRLDEQA